MVQTMAGQRVPAVTWTAQRRLRNRSNNIARQLLNQWRAGIDPDNLDDSVATMLPDLTDIISVAQLVTAQDSIAATTTQIKQTTKLGKPAYTIPAEAWAGTNGNGLTIAQTIADTLTRGKQDIATGTPVQQAIGRMGITLVFRARTALADTYRGASETIARSRDLLCGYVRALTPPSCGRCIILAGQPCGKTPFERHPLCDCTAVWTDGTSHLDISTASPEQYLESLNEHELAHALGSKANAQAWQEGADLNQLINAYRHRGDVRTAQIYDQRIKYTIEGTTRRGLAASRMKAAGYAKEYIKNGGRYTRVDRPRLMPESIYRICGDDADKAHEMLRNYGWIL